MINKSKAGHRTDPWGMPEFIESHLFIDVESGQGETVEKLTV